MLNIEPLGKVAMIKADEIEAVSDKKRMMREQLGQEVLQGRGSVLASVQTQVLSVSSRP